MYFVSSVTYMVDRHRLVWEPNPTLVYQSHKFSHEVLVSRSTT